MSNERLMPLNIAKIKEKAKEEKRQMDVIKAFLKQMKAGYNEELAQYNVVSAGIIEQEMLFERQCKQLNKLKLKLVQMQLAIDEGFIRALIESLRTIPADANKTLLLCFGYPEGIDSSVQLPVTNANHLVEMLIYAETALEDLSVEDKASFASLMSHLSLLKSPGDALGYSVSQIIAYMSVIHDKIKQGIDKTAVLTQHQLLTKAKDAHFIRLKQKEKEISHNYALYKAKSGFIRRIGDLIRQHKQYELLGNNSLMLSEMTAKATELLNAKVDTFDEENIELEVKSHYDDSQSEGVSCSFINDHSVNEDLLQFKQDSNRMVYNGNEVISLSPLVDKEAKNHFFNSSLNKKTQTFFQPQGNPKDNSQGNNNIPQEKTSSAGNEDVSEQISQMIDDPFRYDKPNSAKNNEKGEGGNPIPIVRGKQNKNANYSLK